MATNNNVVILGKPHTTFAFEAYKNLASLYGTPFEHASFVPVSRNSEILNMVMELNAYGIIPMETFHGRIIESLDSFVKLLAHSTEQPFTIIAAVELPIHFCLMARPGVSREQITEVLAHEKGLEVCTKKLSSLKVKTTSVANNGEAARLVAESEEHCTSAALAPRSAAELYGHVILDEAFEDQEVHTTFFLIGPNERKAALGKNNRVLIVYKIPASHKYGALIKACKPFAKQKLSMSQIYNVWADTQNRKKIYHFAVELDVKQKKLPALDRAMKQFAGFINEYLFFCFKIHRA